MAFASSLGSRGQLNVLTPQRAIQPAPLRQLPCARRTARGSLLVRAERRSGPGFVTGFVLGGALCGTLGFIFAPQISKVLMTEDQRLRLPKFLEEEPPTPQQTKQALVDKIAELDHAIDDVSEKLRHPEFSAS